MPLSALHTGLPSLTANPKPVQVTAVEGYGKVSQHTAVCLQGTQGYKRTLCVERKKVERRDTGWGTAAAAGEATLVLGNTCTRAPCWPSQSSVYPARPASLVCEKQDGNHALLSIINARNCM